MDDGSFEGIRRVLSELVVSDPPVVAARLMRNQGRQAALSVDLASTRGEHIMPIAADLRRGGDWAALRC